MQHEAATAVEREAVVRRREGVLDAAYALAAEGGFDAVQMRTVAERGRVALGTLYRYYPSKIHLLVATFGREFGRVAEDLRVRPAAGPDPAARVVDVLDRLADRLHHDRLLTEAMTRGFLFADESAAEAVGAVEDLISTVLVRAIHDDPEAVGEESSWVTARIVRDVWLAALVAWAGGRHTSTETQTYMARAVTRILR